MHYSRFSSAPILLIFNFNLISDLLTENAKEKSEPGGFQNGQTFAGGRKALTHKSKSNSFLKHQTFQDILFSSPTNLLPYNSRRFRRKFSA
jgi:hypothetical protein